MEVAKKIGASEDIADFDNAFGKLISKKDASHFPQTRPEREKDQR